MVDVTFPADTRFFYLLLVAAVAVQRLAELRVSRRNAALARTRGAVEAGAGHYPWMVALHTAFLAACPLEVYLLDRPFRLGLAAAAGLALAAATALRYWAISTLGERWTTRVFVLRGAPPVQAGPYRYLRHPNYLAVVVEMAALPLLHGAWWTALAASAANALLLRARITAEESALAGASDYAAAFAGRPRLLPRRPPG